MTTAAESQPGEQEPRRPDSERILHAVQHLVETITGVTPAEQPTDSDPYAEWLAKSRTDVLDRFREFTKGKLPKRAPEPRRILTPLILDFSRSGAGAIVQQSETSDRPLHLLSPVYIDRFKRDYYRGQPPGWRQSFSQLALAETDNYPEIAVAQLLHETFIPQAMGRSSPATRASEDVLEIYGRCVFEHMRTTMPR